MDAVTQVPTPVNEPVHGYAPGSPERARLEARLKELAENPVDLPMTIGGEKRMGGGERFDVVQPHNHKARLGTYANATQQDAQDAIDAALAAAPAWRAMAFDDRAAIILRAAELLSGPWRETLAASTMLGQSKTAQQAEIDCPCELIDFWRFNVDYAREILAEQPPANSTGVWNRLDHRPLEGFVYAITPFNFTRDRRQSAHRPRPHGQRRGLEALPDPDPRRRPADAAAGGGGPAQGRHQPRHRRRHRGLQGGPGAPRPRRHPLHRLDQDLPVPVEDGRQQHREVPHLPADGRRDRRQGLRRRPPERRPRGPQDRPDPWCLRVPGPEVLVRPPAPTSRRRSGTPASGRSSPPRSTA